MSIYDELFSFRAASVDDADAIMRFIRNEWAPNHILGHNKKLFLFQHDRSEYGENERLNYILMLDRNQEIVGTIGYITYSEDDSVISTTMTKVSSSIKIPMSGVELIKRQMSIVGEKGNFSAGTNPKTLLPIFEKYFHRNCGYMKKYYILNDRIKEYSIPSIIDRTIIPYEQSAYRLLDVYDFEEIKNWSGFNERYSHILTKSREYVNKRFFKHPFFAYRAWKVVTPEGDTSALLFGREVSFESKKMLLLVDYLGDLTCIEKLGSALHNILYEEGYEYIDLLASDLSSIDIEKAGFCELDPEGDNIIPDHLEPLEKVNIKNWYQTNSDTVIFKADGDQDRPNIRERLR